MGKPLTETAIEKLRKQARQHARDLQVPYSQALEHAARGAGFDSWHQVQQQHKATSATVDDLELPLDPQLPPGFFDTPNEERPPAQLDRWWLKPFAQTLPDGRLDVRALDGGAWDRPTYYGTAATMEEARAIAREKLKRWVAVRNEPVATYLGGGFPCVFTIEPDRPGRPRAVVGVGAPLDLAALKGTWSRDAAQAERAIMDARQRAARIPTFDDVAAAMRGRTVHDGAGEASFEQVATLLTVYRLAAPGARTAHFTLPELATYLALGLGVDEVQVEGLLAQAARLLVDARPALTALAQDAGGVWAAKLASRTWGRPARRRARGA